MNKQEEKISMNISLISSCLSGSIHIFIGYPFDTIKTLRQSSSFINTQNMSYKRLFQGIKYPLIQNSLINSTCCMLYVLVKYHLLFYIFIVIIN